MMKYSSNYKTCSFKTHKLVSLQGCWIIWASVHHCKDSSVESKETAYCNSTSTGADLRVCAGVCVVPAGVCGASGGVAQEVCAAVVVTFDPELRAEGGVEAVDDVVVVVAAGGGGGVM